MLSAFSFLLVGNVLAQERTVTGKITSAEDGSSLPGVNVVVKGTTNGAVTDLDGNYKLTVPEEGGILVISFIGLQSQEVNIGSRGVINISMESDVQQLGEVVVTALGISREKRSLGYAVQEISGDEVAAVKPSNIVDGLAGKIAGVQVTGSAGTVGGSSRIIIRGINSIGGNNQPLFVIDGTPMDNSSYNATYTQEGGGGVDYGNAIQDLNPDDIESMTVLKGASAAALYGSRAANGVIMITTKTGKNRKGLGVAFTTGFTMNNAYILPEYQNEYGGGYKQTFDLYNGEPVVNYAADESWGPKMDGTPVRQWYSWYDDDADYGRMTPFNPNPDNVRNFYETGLTTNNSLAISGGNEDSRFRVSYTNFRESGTIPNTQLSRNNLSLNASTSVIKKIVVSTSVNFTNTDNQGIPGQGYGDNAGNVVTSFNQWFQRQLSFDKLRNYQTASGQDRTWNISSPTDLHPLYWENPYYVLYNSPASLNRQRVYGNVSVAYQILEGFSIQGWARTDFYTDRRQEQIASGSVPQDWYTESVRQFRENNYEFLAQYNTNFGDNISFAVNFGANSRQNFYSNNGASTVGGLSVPDFFNINASVDRPNITDYKSQKTVNSVYGSASVGFFGMGFIDVSLRNDWSSSLPEDNNSYLYPSITGSFVFSELLNSSVISLGKFRASWSQVGNDTGPYRTGLSYSSQNNYGNFPAYAVPNTLNNPNLKPETITSREFGIEMAFLNNRVGFDATYYYVEAKDQILSLDVPATSGFTSTVVNAGLLTNEGFELQLSGTPFESVNNGFSWNITVNWARNVNEVVELASGITNYQIASWGPSINAKEGAPYGTWITDGFVYYEDTDQRVVQSNGLYARATNQTYGSYLPDWTGGFINRFTYKGFNLSALIDFQKGGQLYSVTNRYGSYSGLLAATAGNNARGNPMRDAVADGGGTLSVGVLEDGTPNTNYVETESYWKTMRTRREYYLYDASFVKFRELKFGYVFPARFFANTPIERLELAFVGRNLALLKGNVPNVDPESAYGSGNIQGFENGQHPSTRSLGFSLNIVL